MPPKGSKKVAPATESPAPTPAKARPLPPGPPPTGLMHKDKKDKKDKKEKKEVNEADNEGKEKKEKKEKKDKKDKKEKKEKKEKADANIEDIDISAWWDNLVATEGADDSEAAPQEAAPQEAAPQETWLETTALADAAPAENVVPADAAPVDAAPVDAAPAEKPSGAAGLGWDEGDADSATCYYGVVKAIRPDRSCGWITCQEAAVEHGKDPWIPPQSVSDLSPGDKVSFFVEVINGSPQAKNIIALTSASTKRSAESIADGADESLTKKAKLEPDPETRFHGQIKKLLPAKNCGWISCMESLKMYGTDVWFNMSFLPGATEGQEVTFQVTMGKNNKPQVRNLQSVDMSNRGHQSWTGGRTGGQNYWSHSSGIHSQQHWAPQQEEARAAANQTQQWENKKGSSSWSHSGWNSSGGSNWNAGNSWNSFGGGKSSGDGGRTASAGGGVADAGAGIGAGTKEANPAAELAKLPKRPRDLREWNDLQDVVFAGHSVLPGPGTWIRCWSWNQKRVYYLNAADMRSTYELAQVQ